jgi:hypothetical protein
MGEAWEGEAKEGEAKELMTMRVLYRDEEAGNVEINAGASPIQEFCAGMGSTDWSG